MASKPTTLLRLTTKPLSPLLDFLLPAFHPLPRPFAHPPHNRPFTTSPPFLSRVGAEPIPLPPFVHLRLVDPPKGPITRVEPLRTIEVEGPLGTASVQLPPFVNYSLDEIAGKAYLSVLDRKVRDQREMWGTTRTYLSNHIIGVSEGHIAILRLVGVGYRATVEPTAITTSPAYPSQPFVSLKVGYSHPIELGVPLGVKASCPLPTRILLEGVDKETVMGFAARIRKWRVPEPYKGKGIFVNDETIRLKAKKIK
ncbi:MAG: hypothetical protein LQ350_004499 [Teloschistes chrysophthalmus]|nr:MAG: hypothetical protein LQ350_004499 [Niorma chrysophthalma]